MSYFAGVCLFIMLWMIEKHSVINIQCTSMTQCCGEITKINNLFHLQIIIFFVLSCTLCLIIAKKHIYKVKYCFNGQTQLLIKHMKESVSGVIKIFRKKILPFKFLNKRFVCVLRDLFIFKLNQNLFR